MTPISAGTNTPGKPIPVQESPIDIAITPDGKTAHVANFNGGSGDSVTPISTATNRAGKPIKGGLAPLAQHALGMGSRPVPVRN